VDIVRLEAGDEAKVLASGELFDAEPSRRWAEKFLGSDTHHLLLAIEDDKSLGFVSGVETTHPDKGTEMFLYELSVHPEHRLRGIGRALVDALAKLARERGCYGMWVATEPDNEAATATYLASGGIQQPESVLFVWSYPLQ
jgi:ribosomal-protein-alanine N-acetyltransferase